MTERMARGSGRVTIVVAIVGCVLWACGSSKPAVQPADLPAISDEGGESRDPAPDGPGEVLEDRFGEQEAFEASDPDLPPPVDAVPLDSPPEADACSPWCGEAVCGDDGCGGSCGTCAAGGACVDGACECTPQAYRACCGNAVCWYDSCGAQGLWIVDCPKGCDAAGCLECEAQCEGRTCGEDGCGRECGQCTGGQCDGLAWTMPPACVGGQCLGGGARQDCDDGNACTRDRCDPRFGCGHAVRKDDVECDPGRCEALVWTRPRTCLAGICGGGGGTESCQDGNPCTEDACFTATGCLFTPNTRPCDDQDPCTTGDSCSQGLCAGTGMLDCDDGNPCSTDECVQGAGCQHGNEEDGISCGSGTCAGLVFSPGAACVGGACTGSGGAPMDCDDGRACTLDRCDAASGCLHDGIDGTCLIDGECHQNGATKGACLRCNAALDKNGWTVMDACSDDLPCTVDTCDPATGACGHEIASGYCLVDGACFADGQSGAEPCRVCDTDQTNVTWTRLPEGTPCGAGSCNGLTFTKAGTCQSGTCVSLGTRDCSDGLGCTQDACTATGCTNVVLPGACRIDGTCFQDGAPIGKCQECRPSFDTSNGTYVAGKACDDGNPCTKDDACIAGGAGDAGCRGTAFSCDDGLSCTTDACDGAGGCTHALVAGTCRIGGACWGEGQANPANPCQACAPGTSATEWSPVADGLVCASAACSGLVFTAARTCLAGQCTGGGAIQNCNDANTCTTDTCTTSGCGNAIQAGSCLIPGYGCILDGLTNPVNICEACTTAKSKTAWTDRANGTQCEAGSCSGSIWTKPRTCLSGECTGGGGTQDCVDSLACTTDSCTPTLCSNVLQAGKCLIGGACHSDGALNPANACQACTTSTATLAWTVLADGTSCGSGGQVCHDGACCTPQCAGKTCGDDGCGGSCGTCSADKNCQASVCIPKCATGYVWVKPGEFDMGSPASEPGRNTDEVVHHVKISRGFCLKTTEVTQAEWKALMGNNPSYFSACGTTCPVEQVSWWDSAAYCNALSAKEGLQSCYTLTGCTGTPGDGAYACTGVTFAGLACTGYRLPTESEWEYAARAGTTTATYNGTGTLLDCTEPNSILDPIAWFCGNSITTTRPVKGKRVNPWGLYDMLGNVWEWCGDLTGTYPTGTVTDPTGPATGPGRIDRGGAYRYEASWTRSALRSYNAPGNRWAILGFRPAKTAP